LDFGKINLIVEEDLPIFGYSLKEDAVSKKNRLIKNDFKSGIVREMFDLYMTGYTLKDVSEEMKERYKDGFDKNWTKSAAAFILSNEIYTGRLVWDRRGGVKNPVKHEEPVKSLSINKENAVVTPSEWEDVLDIKSAQAGTGNKPRYYSTPFLLKEKLYCGICGSPMKCRSYSDREPTYYCPGKSEEELKKPCPNDSKEKPKKRSELIFPKHYIEKIAMDKIREFLMNEVKGSENFLWRMYESKTTSEKERLSREFEEVKALIEENERLRRECDKFIRDRDSFQLNNSSDDFNEVFIAVESYKTHLTINHEHLERSKEAINIKLESSFSSKDEFRLRVKKAVDVLTALDTSDEKNEKIRQRQRRMFIDRIIDRITAYPSNKGTNLSIVFRFPHRDFEELAVEV
jgi:site-specific DNA recombinase